MPATSSKIGVLVAQLGTPETPTTRSLRPYLREFLSDPRVIDLHPLRWYPILYLFVLTLRPKRSAALYANIWTDEGSPLMVHSRAQTSGLQKRLGDDYRVLLGMRYGEPSIARAVGTMEEEGSDRILVFPMYPQFSCTTTGSIYDAVNRAVCGRRCPWFFDRKRSIPALRFVPPYYAHPAYIDALRQAVAAARGGAITAFCTGVHKTSQHSHATHVSAEHCISGGGREMVMPAAVHSEAGKPPDTPSLRSKENPSRGMASPIPLALMYDSFSVQYSRKRRRRQDSSVFRTAAASVGAKKRSANSSQAPSLDRFSASTPTSRPRLTRQTTNPAV